MKSENAAHSCSKKSLSLFVQHAVAFRRFFFHVLKYSYAHVELLPSGSAMSACHENVFSARPAGTTGRPEQVRSLIHTHATPDARPR